MIDPTNVIKLYSKDQTGNIRFWSIQGYKVKGKYGYTGELEMKYGVVGGQITTQYEDVEDGKAGRTLEEQIQSRINSRMDKKMQSGYVHNLEDAKKNVRVNKLGLKRPMTASKYKDMMHRIVWEDGQFLQRKYNGFRCIMVKTEDGVIAYSRNGLLLENLDHIKEQLDRDMDVGDTLDGELYAHGVKFQTVSSWIKKNQPETKQVKYVIYDTMQEGTYSERYSWLHAFFRKGENYKLAPTDVIYSPDELNKRVTEFINDGYEGGILRTNMIDKYEDGKRSRSLIKVKRFHDAEFRIVRITDSKEGWAILHCVTDSGVEFKMSAPGDMIEKEKIYQEREKYIGQYVNAEYAELTKDGKPFHAVAKYIRNPHSE